MSARKQGLALATAVLLGTAACSSGDKQDINSADTGTTNSASGGDTGTVGTMEKAVLPDSAAAQP